MPNAQTHDDDAALLAMFSGVVDLETRQLTGGGGLDGRTFGRREIQSIGDARLPQISARPRNYHNIVCQLVSAFERRGVDAVSLMRLVTPGPLSARDFADASAFIQRHEFTRTLRGPVLDGKGKRDTAPLVDMDKPTLAMAILFKQPGIGPTELARMLAVARSTLYSGGKWADVAKFLRGKKSKFDDD